MSEYNYVTLLMDKLTKIVPDIYSVIFKYSIVDNVYYRLVFRFNRYVKMCKETENQLLDMLNVNNVSIDKVELKRVVNDININTYDRANQLVFVYRILVRYNNDVLDTLIDDTSILREYIESVSI